MRTLVGPDKPHKQARSSDSSFGSSSSTGAVGAILGKRAASPTWPPEPHDLKDVALQYFSMGRAAILETADRVDECLKWRTPTFTYRGNIARFNPRSKKHVSLMFNTGRTIPGD
jgi:hypothetical protein